jgi:hypothetical protein
MNAIQCECSELPEIVKLDAHPTIERNSDELEKGDWIKLVCCRACGQLWRLNEWDKYQIQFAFKIGFASGSPLSSREHYRMGVKCGLLIRSGTPRNSTPALPTLPSGSAG